MVNGQSEIGKIEAPQVETPSQWGRVILADIQEGS